MPETLVNDIQHDLSHPVPTTKDAIASNGAAKKVPTPKVRTVKPKAKAKAKPVKKAAKPVKVAAKKPMLSNKEFLEQREKELRAKYRHVVAGTIQRGVGDHEGKLTVKIKCTHPGCSAQRRVATSDLFQVHFCEEHQRAARNAAKAAAKKSGKKKSKKR